MYILYLWWVLFFTFINWYEASSDNLEYKPCLLHLNSTNRSIMHPLKKKSTKYVESFKQTIRNLNICHEQNNFKAKYKIWNTLLLPIFKKATNLKSNSQSSYDQVVSFFYNTFGHLKNMGSVAFYVGRWGKRLNQNLWKAQLFEHSGQTQQRPWKQWMYQHKRIVFICYRQPRIESNACYFALRWLAKN